MLIYLDISTYILFASIVKKSNTIGLRPILSGIVCANHTAGILKHIIKIEKKVKQ